jgi:hypothetical protein
MADTELNSDALDTVPEHTGETESTDQQSDGAQDYEAEARVMGWRPEPEWRGDPSAFVSAEEFVRRGKEITPILRKNNEKLIAEIRQRDDRIAQIQATMQQLVEFNKGNEERAYTQALADLKQQRKDAVSSMDGDRFAEVEEQIEAMNAAREIAASVNTAPQPPASQPAIDPSFETWSHQNSWYLEDAGLRRRADIIGKVLREEGNTDSGEAFLNKVRDEMVEMYPDKIGTARRQAGRVEGTSSRASRSNGKSYRDLPSEAKALCDTFVRDIPGFTREQYVTDYFRE